MEKDTGGCGEAADKKAQEIFHLEIYS